MKVKCQVVNESAFDRVVDVDTTGLKPYRNKGEFIGDLEIEFTDGSRKVFTGEHYKDDYLEFGFTLERNDDE